MSANKIIAVVGMCGSGKTEAVKYFVDSRYKKVYFGDVVMEELKRKSLEINEKNEKETREQLRKDFGMGAMAVKSLDKIKEYFTNSNVVVESLYSWDEFKILKGEFGNSFKLLAVHTPKDLRYERLQKRVFRPLSLRESISRDYSEIEKLDKGGPIAFADYFIINDSTIEDLNKKLKEYL